jgi:hypothetical protein
MATIAAAALAAGATAYAAKQANKRSGSERRAEDQLNQNSQQAGMYGQQMLGQSKQALDPVMAYFQSLATGDREALMQYLSPEIAAQGQMSRQAFQTSSELSPRSGMGVEATSRIPFDNAAALSKLIASARPAGMQGLAQLGTQMAGLGFQGLGQGSAGAGQVLNYGADRRNDARSQGMMAGENAFELFKLIQGAAANRKAGNGGSFWGGGAAGVPSSGSIYDRHGAANTWPGVK